MKLFHLIVLISLLFVANCVTERVATPKDGFIKEMPKPNYSREGQGWTGDYWNNKQYVGFVYLL